MKLFKAGWLLAYISISTAVAAEPLTLKEAERMALENSPALAAAGKQTEAMAAVPAQAGSLPDPMISLNALNLPIDSFSTTAENMTQMQVGISQSLPFPGKLALKARAATHMAEVAARGAEEFRLMLIRNVKIRWWNLAYLDRAMMLVQSNQSLLRNLVRVSEAKYKTGKGLQQDVLLAQLELSHLLEKELVLKAEREVQAARLNALIGRPAGLSVVLPQTLPELVKGMPDVDTLIHDAKNSRPLLAGLEQRVEAADSMVALAEKDYYPDFRIGAAYGYRQGINPVSRQSRSDLASIMFSMNLPLYSGSKQDRAVDQRKAERAKAQFDWQDAILQVNAEIEAAASELRITREQLSLFKQGIIPQARQTSASMLAGYQVNKVDFLNLVRAQLAEFNNDIQYWQLYARAAQAEARLAAASGKKNLNKDVINYE